jgi:serine/threonine protein kinase
MGKYKILKKLGEGSFGTVFLVEDEKDHASYVLKQISLTGMTAQELADCKKEISILSLLNHENIVKYIRSFTTKSTLCIVMEFADGGDLQKEIETAREKKSFFDEDRVLTWFTQVACALQHVHALRILHRDLKTQNIFLMKNGDVKLGDFGISRVLTGTMDKATTLVGTPYYLSPEMVNGQPYNQRTDVCSIR